MTDAFFEGPEKKFELVVSEERNLRELGRPFWEKIVHLANAKILSEISTEACTAYLLSESSLFVFDHHATMLTCGETTLVDAATELITRLSAEHVELFIYERKNEAFPEHQRTTFRQDAARVNALIPGKAFRFGEETDHRIRVFHSDKTFVPDDGDTTIEILMHRIDPESARRFIGCVTDAECSVAEQVGLTSTFPGFVVDEHGFSPAGYSMNALSGDRFYTVHVTPERVGSYISFESNIDFRHDFNGLVQSVLDIFKPLSFDVMTFMPNAKPPVLDEGTFRIKDRISQEFLGYQVTFYRCYVSRAEFLRAEPLSL